MILKCDKCARSHQLRGVLKDFSRTTCEDCGLVGRWSPMFFHENASRGVNIYRTKLSRRQPVELWALRGAIGHKFVRHHADAIGQQGSLL